MVRFAHHLKLGLVVVLLFVVRPHHGAAGDTERVALHRVRERECEGAIEHSKPRSDEREWIKGLCEQSERGPVRGGQVEPAALVDDV